MTGHSGASTFPADNPREAVRRLTTVLGADTGMSPGDALRLIGEAVDVLVQIGIRHEVRRVTAVANVSRQLSEGDIAFEPIYVYAESSAAEQPRWEKLGDLRPRMLAEWAF